MPENSSSAKEKKCRVSLRRDLLIFLVSAILTLTLGASGILFGLIFVLSVRGLTK